MGGSSSRSQQVTQAGVEGGGVAIAATGPAEFNYQDITPEVIGELLQGATSLADVMARLAERGLDLSVLTTQQGYSAVREAIEQLAAGTVAGYEHVSGIASEALQLLQGSTIEAFRLLPELLGTTSAASQREHEAYLAGLTQLSATTQGFLQGLTELKARELAQATETETAQAQRNLLYAAIVIAGLGALALIKR